MRRVALGPTAQWLQADLGATSVVGVPVIGEHHEAWLLALNVPRVTSDDLTLATIVARQSAASLDAGVLLERVRASAAVEERVRLARELHDGVLQALTGACLRLEAIHPLLHTDKAEVQRRLREAQDMLAQEQRALRFFIQEIRPALAAGNDGAAGLPDQLGELFLRIKSVWNLHVDGDVAATADLRGRLVHEVYRIVQEALVNAARHGGATAARVQAVREPGNLRVVVSDTGRGFKFWGRFTMEQLDREQLGPVTLKERVAALGGTLMIESNDRGARVEVTIPVPA
jgi:signal transduction histidine kinase